MNWHSLIEDPPRLTEQTLGHHFVLYSAKRGSATCVVENDIADKVRRLTNSGWTHWDWIELPSSPPVDPLDMAIQEMLKSNAERAVVARNFYEMGKAAALVSDKEPPSPVPQAETDKIQYEPIRLRYWDGSDRPDRNPGTMFACACGVSRFRVFCLDGDPRRALISCCDCDLIYMQDSKGGWELNNWKPE